jgi:hypothetical protein
MAEEPGMGVGSEGREGEREKGLVYENRSVSHANGL